MSAISLPGYTTAMLSATRYLTATRRFVVGDNATYGAYRNVPLTPNTVYVFYFVIAVAWDGVVKMSFNQLLSPVRTTAHSTTAGGDGMQLTTEVGQAAAGSADVDGRIMIAVIVSVGLFGLLVVAALVTIVCWRRKLGSTNRRRDDVSSHTGNDVIRNDIGTSRQTSGMQYHSEQVDRCSSLDDGTQTFVSIEHKIGNVDGPRDLLVADIASYRSVALADEFRQLSTIDDGPRATDETTRSHRYLSGYRGRKRSYIVTGAPSDAVSAFTDWAVIYQEGVSHVVSVASGVAAASATLNQPDEGEERQFGNISVRTVLVRRLAHATTTTFQIRRTDDDDALPRRVRQYDFTDWPIVDEAVPSVPLHFVEFFEAVRASSRRSQTGASLAPLLVRRPTSDEDSGNSQS